MKKKLLILIAGLLLVTAAACSNSQSVDSTGEAAAKEPQAQEEPGEPPDDNPNSIPIIFDFSYGSAEPDLREEIYHYSGDNAEEAMLEGLSSISGLDFLVTFSTSDDGSIIADWAADSTLITGLGDREMKEDFTFFDNDSMRWFMMDSLWQTLGGEENVYYTMDGGKELRFDELTMTSIIPSDIPYMGSAFFFSHSGVVGDYWFIDDEYGFTLNYSNKFAPEPEDENAPVKLFPSQQNENVVLQYWVTPNINGETAEALAESSSADETNVFENTVAGRGSDLDQLTGEVVPTAFVWLVEDDWIAHAAVICETEEDASFWHSQIVVSDAIMIQKDEEVSIGEEEAMDVLFNTIDMAEGTALVAYGKEVIDGVDCWTFAYGADTPEKFTAEAHYAVTAEGAVLIFDLAENTYKSL